MNNATVLTMHGVLTHWRVLSNKKLRFSANLMLEYSFILEGELIFISLNNDHCICRVLYQTIKLLLTSSKFAVKDLICHAFFSFFPFCFLSYTFWLFPPSPFSIFPQITRRRVSLSCIRHCRIRYRRIPSCHWSF